MLAVYIWFYIFFLAIIWWFFFVARIHSYKFKNFSPYIVKVTNLLMFFLLFLSILWLYIIYKIDSWYNQGFLDIKEKNDYEQDYY